MSSSTQDLPNDKALAKRLARYFAKNGLKFEKTLMNRNKNDPRISFLRNPEDPLHGYYKQKLSKYLSQSPVEVNRSVASVAAASSQRMRAYEDKLLLFNSLYQQEANQPQPIVLPNLIEFRLPKGMNGSEFRTMKLTAQFGAWYGNDFWLGFKDRPGFEFTNPTDTRFPRFTRFVLEYSEVLKPPKGLKEQVSKNDAYMAAIHDSFFRLLERDILQEMEWQLQDWHASLEKDFADNNKDTHEELPPSPETGMSSQEPEIKRQKFDDQGLVPEDQFLAQHPFCRVGVQSGFLLSTSMVVSY